MANKRKNTVISLVVFVLVIAALLGVYLITREKPNENVKTVSVEIVYDDTDKTVSLSTDAEYLGEALIENGLIEGEENAYGLFVTAADGRTADSDKQEWWGLTKDGEFVDTGVYMTVINDGDKYELTLQIGW